MSAETISDSNMRIWIWTNAVDPCQLVSFPHRVWLCFAIWRRTICRIYWHINISEKGASSFISFCGSCYHFSLNRFCLSVWALSLCHVFFFLAHLNLFLPQTPVLWNCISTLSVCRLLSACICPSLSVRVRLCAFTCACAVLTLCAACNTLWGFICIKGLFKCRILLYSQVVFDSV